MQTSSNFGGNLTFENSSIFDENNNEKIFVGSKSIYPIRKSQGKLRKGVEHKGKDIKGQYTLNIPTLFSSARIEMQQKMKTEIAVNDDDSLIGQK